MLSTAQRPSNSLKNVGFISTRIAGTDGVSLEIEKWTEVLEHLGCHCFFFAGELDRPESQSYFVEEAHFEHPEILRIDNDIFGGVTRLTETSSTIQEIKYRLKACLYDFLKEFEIDVIIPENALAIPMNIPLGIAITELVAETGMPTIAHHHDFHWERKRFLINACKDYLDMAFPPDLPSIRHVVINSLASRQLSYERGISNEIIPNVYNFAVPPPSLDASRNLQLRKEIGLQETDSFILQPTRVVARKWIERSIEIVRHLDVNDRVLVISHATGDEGDDYYSRILEYAKDMGVTIASLDHLIASKHQIAENDEKLYSIRDIYQTADLVTYPSGYEGFGNAFLEALYFKRPIVVNRYSIYVADIEPKGFDVIVMDGFVTSKTIEKIHEVLDNPNRLQEMVEKNYRLARKSFSYEVLEEKLSHLLRTF
jgi:glycosyltransferase involved in cell wall biosynthesis